MVNSRGQSLERTVNLIRRRYAKRQRRCGGIADSSGFQIMKLDGSPLDTNPLSSTTVKTATPRGMLSQHRGEELPLMLTSQRKNPFGLH